MDPSVDTTLDKCCGEVAALRPWETQIFGGGQANKSAEWLFLCGPCFYLQYSTTVSLIDAGSKEEEVW